MGRIVAIDWGKKRTGIAVTDPAGIIATPLSTVETALLEEWLKEYGRNEPIDSFVIGYPLQLNNQPSESVEDIDRFIGRLKKIFPLKEINLVDERFTSVLAQRAMIDGGVKKMKRRDKAIVDRVSASLILQSFLEKQNKGKR